MKSKFHTAVNVLRKRGPLSLASVALTQEIPYGKDIVYHASLRQIEKHIKKENDLDDILDTVLDVKPGYRPYELYAGQIRGEIEELTTLVDNSDPKTILEIGTNQGGTLYIWCRYIDSVNKIVSLDLPGGDFGGGYDQKMTGIFQSFSSSKDMYFIRGDSHQEEVSKDVSNQFSEGVDFLFIDGDHTYEGVKKDFEMYSEIVNEDGIVAFHDIVHHPTKPTVNVDQFWKEITEEYETREIIKDRDQGWAGIGVVYL